MSLPSHDARSTLRSVLLVAAAVLAAGGLAACSGGSQATVNVRYDDTQDSTTYQAGPIRVEPSQSAMPQSSNMGSVTNDRRRRQRRQQQTRRRPPGVQLHAFARCAGTDCTPTDVSMTLQVDQGPVRRGGPLSLSMSGRSYDWATMRVSAPTPALADNLIGTVTLSWTQFQELAQAQIVEGSVSGISFESDYEERRAFRRLLDRAGLGMDDAGNDASGR
jgi:hypothetical protein